MGFNPGDTVNLPSGGTATRGALFPQLYGGSSSGGIAQGQIRIDTRSLAQSRAVVVREAQIMGDAIKRNVGDGTQQGVETANRALASLRQSFASVQQSAALIAATLTTLGVRSAQNVKVLEARFRLLAGSEEEATEKLEELRDLADRTGQPFLDLVEGATAIMPALRGTNADLSKTLTLVQRLAVMDPAQGVTGAAFAMREFLNEEYISMVRRLEFDRQRLREILDEADGDVAKAIEGLDEYVAELGLGEEQLMEFGRSGANAFAILRSEGTETLAEFFSPFLNDVLVPLVRTFADFLRQLRATNPELQKFIGIATGLSAVSVLAQRGLPLIGQIPGGAMIGKLGVTAAAGYIGGEIGVAGARGLGKLGVPGFEGFAEASQEEARHIIVETLKQVAVIIFDAFVEVAKSIVQAGMYLKNAWELVKAAFGLGVSYMRNAFASVVDILAGAAAGIVTAIAGLLRGLDEIDLGWFGNIETGAGKTAEEMEKLASSIRGAGDSMRISESQMQGYTKTLRRGIELTPQQIEKMEGLNTIGDELVLTFAETVGAVEEAEAAVHRFVRAAQLVTSIPQRDEPKGLTFDEDAKAAWLDFQDDMAELARNTNDQLLDETRQFEARRAEIIKTYQQQVLDIMEEDAIRYQRALQNARDREAEIRANLAESLADAEVDNREKVNDLLARYREEDERAAEKHLDRLRDIQRDGREQVLRAAMKLDAVALWEAQRSTKIKVEDEKDAYEREREDRQEALDKALRLEMESYDERLQAQRAAADKSITQLWERFRKEEQLQREDMARRLSQMRRDHAQQLNELRSQHYQRMGQIRQEGQEERRQRQMDFINTMNEIQRLAGVHQANLISIAQRGEALIEGDFRAWWNRMQTVVNPGAAIGQALMNLGSGSRDVGGRVMQTGLMRLRQGEEVISAGFANTLRRMMGGEVSQPSLVAAVAGAGGAGGRNGAGGGGTMPLVHWTGNIVVNGAGEPQTVAQRVRDELYKLFQEMGG